MIINPYNNGYNKFSYTIDELNYIDDCWNLIDIFSTSYLTKSELREKIILFVSTSYSPEEFERLEIIIEKMYWNIITLLRDILYQSYIEQKTFTKETTNINSQFRKIYKKNKILAESCVNKILLKKDKNIFYKYEYPNNFDKIITSIMLNRTVYETIYNNMENLDIDKIKHFISGENVRESFDYLFPNINSIKSFWYNNRIFRVKKYYYEKNNSDINWFIYF